MTTILVDPASCSARVSGVVCLGTTFDFAVSFEGGALDPETLYSEAVVKLFDDSNVALNVAPAVASDWTGQINLATDEAVALFEGKKPQDKINVTVAVWNATDNRMLGMGTITIINNPFVFSTNSVEEIVIAAFAARVSALEAHDGKVPDLNTGNWVNLYARTIDDVRQLTFEATV